MWTEGEVSKNFRLQNISVFLRGQRVLVNPRILNNEIFYPVYNIRPDDRPPVESLPPPVSLGQIVPTNFLPYAVSFGADWFSYIL